ncbi:MAG: substrate-binding domain-containing protein [Planctomycetota bacterium]|jgi:DNA-binding LacI/PurR family transcriptional regulator
MTTSSTKSNKFNPKYKEIAQTLKRRIKDGSYTKGQKLPTIKNLTEEFSASFVTVFRATELLAEEGLVSKGSRKSGTIVLDETQKQNTNCKTIGCLLRAMSGRSDMDNFGLDIMEGIRKTISENEYRFIYHSVDEAEYERRIIELIDKNEICGLILDAKTPLSTLKILSGYGLPSVMYNRHEEIDNLSTVLPDYEAIARNTVTLFKKQGYQRVSFCKIPANINKLTEEKTGDYFPILSMKNSFYTSALEAGYSKEDIILIPEPERDLAETPEAYGLLSTKDQNWKSIGILANNDELALTITKAVNKTNLVIGKDVGIVGCFNLDGAQGPDAPDTWDLNPSSIGSAAANLLIDRIESPELPASNTRLTAKFIDRNSI